MWRCLIAHPNFLIFLRAHLSRFPDFSILLRAPFGRSPEYKRNPTSWPSATPPDFSILKNPENDRREFVGFLLYSGERLKGVRRNIKSLTL